MPDPFNRKPWSMKWVVMAILLMIVPYTILTVKYRKTGPAYQPYEDSKQRANVMRLLDAGYQRLNVNAERPADPQNIVRAMNTLIDATPAPAGVTEGLTVTLVEIPQLPESFGAVSASNETASLLPYPILFTCALGDQKHQLGGAQVYLRGYQIVIVPQFEPLDGDLTARTKESTVLVTIPGGALKPGTYNAHLAGSTQSRQWTFNVR